jgi:aminoglycoside phosphotransferase (APT) family kinase protein
MDPSTGDACPVEITSTLVESLVASQFPDWSGRSVRILEPGGWDNRTFRLGDDLLVRLPSHARYVAQVPPGCTETLPFIEQMLRTPLAADWRKLSPSSGAVALGSAKSDFASRGSSFNMPA